MQDLKGDLSHGLIAAFLVQYEGTPAARQALQKAAATSDIVVMSYESVRADIEWVAQQQWLYCVLDEGHVIRNPKAKLTQVMLSNLTVLSLTITPGLGPVLMSVFEAMKRLGKASKAAGSRLVLRSSIAD